MTDRLPPFNGRAGWVFSFYCRRPDECARWERKEENRVIVHQGQLWSGWWPQSAPPFHGNGTYLLPTSYELYKQRRPMYWSAPAQVKSSVKPLQLFLNWKLLFARERERKKLIYRAFLLLYVIMSSITKKKGVVGAIIRCLITPPPPQYLKIIKIPLPREQRGKKKKPSITIFFRQKTQIESTQMRKLSG